MARDSMSLAAFIRKNEYIKGEQNNRRKPLNLFIFPQISVLSQLLILAAVMYKRRSVLSEMRALAVYFVLCSMVTIIQVLLAMKGMNNLWTAQFFCPIQFALLMYVFYAWNRQSKAAALIGYSIPVFVVGWCLSAFLLSNPAYTLTYADPISAAAFVLVSSYTLLTLDRHDDSSVTDLPEFWVSSATIMYFGGTLVFSSLQTSILRASIQTMQLAWALQAVVNILANLLYAGGFLCLRRKT